MLRFLSQPSVCPRQLRAANQAVGFRFATRRRFWSCGHINSYTPPTASLGLRNIAQPHGKSAKSAWRGRCSNLDGEAGALWAKRGPAVWVPRKNTGGIDTCCSPTPLTAEVLGSNCHGQGISTYLGKYLGNQAWNGKQLSSSSMCEPIFKQKATGAIYRTRARHGVGRVRADPAGRKESTQLGKHQPDVGMYR